MATSPQPAAFPLLPSPSPAPAGGTSATTAALGGPEPLIGLPDPLVLAHTTLEALLAPAQVVVGRRACRRLDPDALLVWGRRRSGLWGEREAVRKGLPLWRVEDAFLRSVDPGPGTPPLGILLDDRGIHYDASRPSRLEGLIASGLDPAQQQRARQLAAAWREHRVSKLNGARESPPPDGPFVLVVDQVAGDVSIRHGAASAASFLAMLEAALQDFPGHQVVLKTHPDVVSGQRRGHVPAEVFQHPRVLACADGGHPAALLEAASAVYVVTSQMGFEALIWGRPVHCFGMPFYAGWGLTHDRLPATDHPARAREARAGGAQLEDLVHACLVGYARYLNPETRQLTSPEALIAHVGLQRRQRAAVPPALEVFGIAGWKRQAVRRFQRSLSPGRLRFRPFHARPTREAGWRSLVWGNRVGLGLRKAGSPLIHAEDGFLRSVGQGWWLRWVPPVSWVVDHSGIYYDASCACDLETFLAQHRFTAAQRQRAAALRQRIVAAGVTKYNLRAPLWSRPSDLGRRQVRLVPGQVEVDLSIRYGVPEQASVRSNLQLLQAVRAAYPDDFLIYKPHPDVVSGRQKPGPGEAEAHRHCDLVLAEAPMDHLLQEVDSVHVRTSITGFEALLRGIPVETWGLPFYAGWGLSRDQLQCERRGRDLELDELVYGALIHYPIYLSQASGAFTTPERVVEELGLLRRDPGTFPTPLPRWLELLGLNPPPKLHFRLAQIRARLRAWSPDGRC
ncbi:capsular polysaccharide biosynthesis protein [Cyanobium sp. NS01]|uniref:capsular polysaccharide biosynthesis protein n=1 Tax=Cyanobium sp. NS01 TaxID=261284 RepID=UPI00164587DC|nr:capsular polysaccharide biosynthesis protein [Cyanobium sp. NS01]